eukprot:Skav216832  [mRNA]  locus=scaffold3965:4682:12899:- [translate_table: standard]
MSFSLQLNRNILKGIAQGANAQICTDLANGMRMKANLELPGLAFVQSDAGGTCHSEVLGLHEIHAHRGRQQAIIAQAHLHLVAPEQRQFAHVQLTTFISKDPWAL